MLSSLADHLATNQRNLLWSFVPFMLNIVSKCQYCLLQGRCVRSVWTPVSPSLVPLGQHVTPFHRGDSSACVHLAGRGNCAKTVSEYYGTVPQTLFPWFFSFSHEFCLLYTFKCNAVTMGQFRHPCPLFMHFRIPWIHACEREFHGSNFSYCGLVSSDTM
jgi:hypothetical protein